jgi:PAS domain S-box-containing protein
VSDGRDNLNGSEPDRAELLERNRALQALNALAVRLLRLNTATAVYDAALDGVLAIVGACYGAVALADDVARHFQVVTRRSCSNAGDALDYLPYDQPFAHNRARTTGDLVIIHYDEANALTRRALDREHAQTVVLLPLFGGARVIGVLSYLLAAHHDCPPDERELLRTAATYVGMALDRVQLYEVAEAERARLARILEELPVGVYLAEGDAATRSLRWTLINAAGQAQVGTPLPPVDDPAASYGIYWPDGRPVPVDERPMETALWTGQSTTPREYVLRAADGTERVVLSSAHVLREGDGTREAVLVAQEMTDLVRARHEIEGQRELLETIFEATPIGISVFDQEMRLLNFNHEYSRQVPIDPATARGQVFYDLVPSARERTAIHEQVFAGIAAEAEAVPYEYPDGTVHYCDLRYLPLRNEVGVVTGMLSTTIDVTTLVRARQEVEDQRALLEAILTGAPVGLALYDRDLRVMNSNTEWARLAGVDPKSVEGRLLYDLIPDTRSRQPIYARVLAGEALDLADVPYRLPSDPQPRYYDLRFRPVRDPAGAVKGILSAVVDVTGRYEADRQKDEFIALASHELKTPLTAIKAYAQTTLRSVRGLGDTRLIRTLRIIDEQSDRLNRLINELLDVSHMETTPLALERAPVDLAELVRETISSLELIAPAYMLALDLPPAPIPIHADRQRVEQVLMNLVQNAIKYSGDSRRVEIGVRCLDAEVVTAVRDFGLGIPTDQQEQVFARFFRARNVPSRHYSGLGLGLFISHNIVTRHGGRMWLESYEGVGSTFYFALPLAMP